MWLLSVLCREVEPREEWLALARHGIEFIERYGFDHDGKMFFQVTREGEPLRMRRYLFTETFAAIAFAAYGAVTGEMEYVRKAYDLYHFIEQYRPERESMLPKVNPSVPPAKGIGLTMQKINMLHVLRASGDDGSCTARIDLLIEEIVRDFIKEEQGWILETVGPDGEFIDHFEGRQIAPGHLIEVAWFILHDARVRGSDAGLIRLGCRILDWAWEAGWDEEYGGIIYYRGSKVLTRPNTGTT